VAASLQLMVGDGEWRRPSGSCPVTLGLGMIAGDSFFHDFAFVLSSDVSWPLAACRSCARDAASYLLCRLMPITSLFSWIG
jgi:hypothetical protein